MEEATFLTKYATMVHIIHRRDTFKASKIMQQKALTNPRIQVLWNSVVVGAYKDENINNRILGGGGGGGGGGDNIFFPDVQTPRCSLMCPHYGGFSHECHGPRSWRGPVQRELRAYVQQLV